MPQCRAGDHRQGDETSDQCKPHTRACWPEEGERVWRGGGGPILYCGGPLPWSTNKSSCCICPLSLCVSRFGFILKITSHTLKTRRGAGWLITALSRLFSHVYCRFRAYCWSFTTMEGPIRGSYDASSCCSASPLPAHDNIKGERNGGEQLCVQGWAFLEQEQAQGPGAAYSASESFRAALVQDPTLASAWAGRALAFLRMGAFG
jgi:hypothetical protein